MSTNRIHGGDKKAEGSTEEARGKISHTFKRQVDGANKKAVGSARSVVGTAQARSGTL